MTLQPKFYSKSIQTIQGHALAKPHRYAGDYELIDNI